jgi:hypothetical protein
MKRWDCKIIKIIIYMLSKNVKLVVFVPLTHCDTIRKTLGEAGAGKIGNYDFCSFSTPGTGRFIGNSRTNPAVGQSQVYESVEEEKIEVVVPREILRDVVSKMLEVHPYEEVAYDIYPLEEL